MHLPKLFFQTFIIGMESWTGRQPEQPRRGWRRDEISDLLAFCSYRSFMQQSSKETEWRDWVWPLYSTSNLSCCWYGMRCKIEEIRPLDRSGISCSNRTLILPVKSNMLVLSSRKNQAHQLEGTQALNANPKVERERKTGVSQQILWTHMTVKLWLLISHRIKWSLIHFPPCKSLP